MNDESTLRSRAAAWFNQTWTLLDKSSRTPMETLDMLSMAQASFTAWMAEPTHTPLHEAIGAWQVSRGYSVAGEGRLAEAWARRSLAAASDPSVDAYYRAAAREALARAWRVQGRPLDVAAEVLRARQSLLGTDEDDVATLEADLSDLEAHPESELYVSVSVHRPRAGFAALVAGSMHRYAEAARGQPGLVEVRTLEAPGAKVLVGYAVWLNQAAHEAARPALQAAVAHDDFDLWEDGAIEGWGLKPV